MKAAFRYLVLLSLLHHSFLISINLAFMIKGPKLSLDKHFFKENGATQNIYGNNYSKPSKQMEKFQLWEKFVRFLDKLRFPDFQFWNTKSPALSTADSLYTLLTPTEQHAIAESSYASYRVDAASDLDKFEWIRHTDQKDDHTPSTVRRKRSNKQERGFLERAKSPTEHSALQTANKVPEKQNASASGGSNQLMIITKAKNRPSSPAKSGLKVKGRTPKVNDHFEGIMDEQNSKAFLYSQALSNSFPLNVKDFAGNDMSGDGSFLYPDLLLDPNFPLKQQVIQNLLQNQQIGKQNLLTSKPEMLENQQLAQSTNPSFIFDLFNGKENQFLVNQETLLNGGVLNPDNNRPFENNVPLSSFVQDPLSISSLVEDPSSVHNPRDLPLVERETRVHPFITRFEQFALPPTPPSVESVTMMHLALIEMMNNLTRMIQAQNMSSSNYGWKSMDNTTAMMKMTDENESPSVHAEANSQSTPQADVPNTTTTSYTITADTSGDRTSPVDVEKLLIMVHKMMQNMEQNPLSKETMILMEMLDQLARDVFDLDNNKVNESPVKTKGKVSFRQDSSSPNETMMDYYSSTDTTNRTPGMSNQIAEIMSEIQKLRNEMKNSKSRETKKTNTEPMNDSKTKPGVSASMFKDGDENMKQTEEKGVLESMLEQILKLDGGLNKPPDSALNFSVANTLALVALKDELENYSSLPLHMQTLRLPLTKTNILKLVIEAHLLNRTSNSSDSQKGNLRSGSLVSNSILGRHLSSQFEKSNLSDDELLNETLLKFDPSIGLFGIDPLNDPTFLDTFNLTSTQSFGSDNGSLPALSRICHMCVNIFQSPHFLQSFRNNSSDPFNLKKKLELRTLLKQLAGMEGGFNPEINKDLQTPKVSITQVNYAGRTLGHASQSRGWIPSIPTWLQGVDHIALGESSLQGRAHTLPLYPPLSRSEDPEDTLSKKRPSSGFVSFPTNKPFTNHFKMSSTQVGSSLDGKRRPPTSVRIRSLYPVSSSKLLSDSEGAGSHAQVLRQGPTTHGRPLNIGQDFFTRSLPPYSKVSWPRPNFNYHIW